MPTFARALVDRTNSELARFGGRNETDQAARPLLREYWMEGAGFSAAAANKAIAERTAWSAAFISFVALKALGTAGSPAKFPNSAGHWQYVGAAIRNDFNGAPKPAFFGIPATGDGSEPVKPGDIVGCPRTTALDDYEDALRAARAPTPAKRAYPSHFDVVVAVGGGMASLVGGNVSNTVKQVTVTLAPDGRLPVRGFKFNAAGDVTQAPFIALVRLLDS